MAVTLSQPQCVYNLNDYVSIHCGQVGMLALSLTKNSLETLANAINKEKIKVK